MGLSRDPEKYRAWQRRSARRAKERAEERAREQGQYSSLEPGGPITPKPKSPEKFEAQYGSQERVEWVKTLECVVPACSRRSENAHIKGGGVGMKAGPEAVANICAHHHRLDTDSLHHLGSVDRFDERWKTDLREAARSVDRRWRAMHHGGTA